MLSFRTQVFSGGKLISLSQASRAKLKLIDKVKLCKPVGRSSFSRDGILGKGSEEKKRNKEGWSMKVKDKDKSRKTCQEAGS